MKRFLICYLFSNTVNSLAKKTQLPAEKKGHPLIVSIVGLEDLINVALAPNGLSIASHIQYRVVEIRGIVGDARPIAVIEGLPYVSFDAEKVFMFVMVQIPELAI